MNIDTLTQDEILVGIMNFNQMLELPEVKNDSKAIAAIKICLAQLRAKQTSHIDESGDFKNIEWDYLESLPEHYFRLELELLARHARSSMKRFELDWRATPDPREYSIINSNNPSYFQQIAFSSREGTK